MQNTIIDTAAKGQLTYAAAVRPGDEIIRDGRGSIVTAVQRARGRKPKVGETLHFFITDDKIIKANSTSPVRLLRKR